MVGEGKAIYLVTIAVARPQTELIICTHKPFNSLLF